MLPVRFIREAPTGNGHVIHEVLARDLTANGRARLEEAGLHVLRQSSSAAPLPHAGDTTKRVA